MLVIYFRIFNEDNDTDDIDINIDKLNEFNKYKKPWYRTNSI